MKVDNSQKTKTAVDGDDDDRWWWWWCGSFVRCDDLSLRIRRIVTDVALVIRGLAPSESMAPTSWPSCAVDAPRVSGQSDARVVVCVNWLAEVDGVLELLSQDLLRGIARHLQQEETCVALRKEVVWRVVFVQDLQSKNITTIKTDVTCALRGSTKVLHKWKKRHIWQ